jgi:excisionase family DNA binding protein
LCSDAATKGKTMSEERFLKLKDVQDRLGVSRATVWRWQAERGLRVVSVGGVVRVRESDLMDFINRHLTDTPGAN